eukprot:scaffold333_cov133-Cylindrotheca_fusiformis.AAC.6
MIDRYIPGGRAPSLFVCSHTLLIFHRWFTQEYTANYKNGNECSSSSSRHALLGWKRMLIFIQGTHYCAELRTGDFTPLFD